MYILGLSAYFHDSSVVLLDDDKILFAASEERFSRLKHDHSFPHNAIQECLRYTGIQFEEISEIVFYEKPLLKYERIIETQIRNFPQSFLQFLVSTPLWLKTKLNLRKTLRNEFLRFTETGKVPDIQFSYHHLSHAASAFYPSPFQESAVLCLDGVGEWSTATMWNGKGNQIDLIAEIKYPDSLGLFYSAFTSYCGFEINNGEYKLMGLASYGKPLYQELILENIIKVFEDGSFKLNQKFFAYNYSDYTFTKAWEELLGFPAINGESEPEQKYRDLAASAQKITEDIIFKMASTLKEKTGSENLCLAGGVALNCVANGKLAQNNIFKNIWIQPASGDDGGALGAALSLYYLKKKAPRDNTQIKNMMEGSLLGPSYSDDEIKKDLDKYGLKYKTFEYQQELIKECCKDIMDQKVIGWFQGRMEYGPRALGGRSIICDPRQSQMRDIINSKIKKRELFRPFGPIILEEDLSNYLENPLVSPYMLIVDQAKTNELAAVVHVDSSTRYQSLGVGDGRLLRKVLENLKREYSLSAIINTSFNIKGEPIVCTPDDSLRCFAETEMDVLYIGNFRIDKVGNNCERVEKPRFMND